MGSEGRKTGPGSKQTQNTSAFFGAVNLIPYHAELDKLGQVALFRMKVTTRDVSKTHDQKELCVPFVAFCLMRNPKLSVARRAEQLRRESRA